MPDEEQKLVAMAGNGHAQSVIAEALNRLPLFN